MLRLTPFREMDSVREVIKEDRVDMLGRQIQVKFSLMPELTEVVTADLEKLEMADLAALVEQILHFNSFEQLETWIVDHLPARIG